MSMFEIVRGVEGDCLVLDGTRICGPKPWGGGRIIKTFHTDGIYEVIDKDEYHKLLDENAKLREQVADTCMQLGGAWVRCSELRDLVRHLYECMCNVDADGNYECDSCEYDNAEGKCDFERLMRELGVGLTDD